MHPAKTYDNLDQFTTALKTLETLGNKGSERVKFVKENPDSDDFIPQVCKRRNFFGRIIQWLRHNPSKNSEALFLNELINNNKHLFNPPHEAEEVDAEEFDKEKAIAFDENAAICENVLALINKRYKHHEELAASVKEVITTIRQTSQQILGQILEDAQNKGRIIEQEAEEALHEAEQAAEKKLKELPKIQDEIAETFEEIDGLKVKIAEQKEHIQGIAAEIVKETDDECAEIRRKADEKAEGIISVAKSKYQMPKVLLENRQPAKLVEELHRDESLKDVVIICKDGKTVSAHSDVLSLSDWFKSIFEFKMAQAAEKGEDKGLTADLSEYSEEAVTAVVNFLYSDEPEQEVLMQNVEEILELSTYLRLKQLESKCLSILIDYLMGETKFEFEVLKGFVTSPYPELQALAMEEVIKNIGDQAIRELAFDLDKKELFTSSFQKNLNIPHEDEVLLTLLRDWAENKSTVDGEIDYKKVAELLTAPISDDQPFCLLDCIDYRFIDFDDLIRSAPNFFTAIVVHRPVFKRDAINIDLYGKTRGFSWRIIQEEGAAKLSFYMPTEVLANGKDLICPEFTLTDWRKKQTTFNFALKYLEGLSTRYVELTKQGSRINERLAGSIQFLDSKEEELGFTTIYGGLIRVDLAADPWNSLQFCNKATRKKGVFGFTLTIEVVI